MSFLFSGVTAPPPPHSVLSNNNSSSSRMSAEQCESLEAVLEKYVPQPELAEVKRILYGKPAT